MANQQINCNVRSCRYNNQGHACALDDILVGNSTAAPHKAKDTECASFEEQ